MIYRCLNCKSEFRKHTSLISHSGRCKEKLTRIVQICEQNNDILARKAAEEEQRIAEEQERRWTELESNNSNDGMMDVDGVETLPQEDPDPPSISASGRLMRRYHAPMRLADYVPSALGRRVRIQRVEVPSNPSAPNAPEAPATILSNPQPLPPPDTTPLVYTIADEFSLYRAYSKLPVSLTDQRLNDSQTGNSLVALPSLELNGPYENYSTLALMHLWNSGSSKKSMKELSRLLALLRDPEFKLDDARKINGTRELKLLDGYIAKNSGVSGIIDNWTTSSVRIPMPPESLSPTKLTEATTPSFLVENIHHRSIINIVKSILTSEATKSFTFKPYRQYWKPSINKPAQRVFGEAYTGDEWLKMQEFIDSLPQDPSHICDVEQVIAALMFWSDSTHLTSFGNQSLWPIYLFFANQSKYERCKPSSHACHHLAFIPKLSDKFQDEYEKAYGRPASANVLKHMRRELVQAVWGVLLDAEFMKAFKDGILLMCGDGILRRVYVRIITYSADYPEKCALNTIRFLGALPCPDCEVQKTDLHLMGTFSAIRQQATGQRIDTEQRQNDVKLAREWIFESGYGVQGAQVERLLQPKSFVPTRNTFSDRFLPYKINYYDFFVPDLMHEFELGVWKSLFTHLIRILVAHGGNSIQLLNKRYRDVPTFGNGTIRLFREDAASMKKLAARDFEDFLQCSIPVFEGLLFEPHNKKVLEILFSLCVWHAHAKLRRHTDSTVYTLRAETVELGRLLQDFLRTTCAAFDTRELPKEIAARGRRVNAKAAASNTGTVHEMRSKKKHLNLDTIKYHFLGKYAESIKQFGTTDSYTTQTGELMHRDLKAWYSRTNKNNAPSHITRIERRSKTLRELYDQYQSRNLEAPKTTSSIPENTASHHHISLYSDKKAHIPVWLEERAEDEAFKDFLPRLKDHLLARLLGLLHTDNSDELRFTDEDRRGVKIVEEKLCFHNTLRINYTTYDGLRDFDTINPKATADIMVLAHEEPGAEAHPYWYARTVLIFHVNVLHDTKARQPKRLDILWVRWYAMDERYPFSWKGSERHLPRVCFPGKEEGDAFSFLDPSDVIRAVHIIPAFHYDIDESPDSLPPSLARRPLSRRHDNSSSLNVDWNFYYINMFVDRDMFMRYRGEAVGHKGTQDLDSFLTRGLNLNTQTAADMDIPDNDDLPELPPPSNNSNDGESSDSDVDDEEEEESGNEGEDDDDLGFDEF